MERKVYRVREAMNVTRLSRSTIYKLLETGQLSRVKIGSCTLIPAEEVDALLQRCAV